jgi:hypothetical protein
LVHSSKFLFHGKFGGGLETRNQRIDEGTRNQELGTKNEELPERTKN